MLAEQQKIIQALSVYVAAAMPPDPTGHDWPHIQRVLRNAEQIQAKEGGDLFRITLIALTHDLYDHKFFKGTTQEAKDNLLALLVKNEVDTILAGQVVNDVFSLSFKGGRNGGESLSEEGKIVQDADRLEAIGAIGIARAFAYGGYKQRLMHAVENRPEEGTTFDHFFEKLLKLYDLLNTASAKEMATRRFAFMQDFVKHFEAEWG